jgi:opacity protein-like surface antigen
LVDFQQSIPDQASCTDANYPASRTILRTLGLHRRRKTTVEIFVKKKARGTRKAAVRLNCSRLGLATSFLFAALTSIAARAQTDVALSLYGTFSSTTTYQIGLEHQTSVDAAGGLFELRHISNPFVGYEVTYSLNRDNQVYAYTGTTPVGSLPGIHPVAVSANAHEITGDWLFSLPAGKLRPFALVGVGLLLTEPVSGQSQATSSNEPVYVYGGGLDWKLVPHFGLRLQYRGNLYKAPNITAAYGFNGSLMHTAEPMIGAYFKF